GGGWPEYENPLYVTAAVLLLCIYFLWFMSKINVKKITDFAGKRSFILLLVFCIFYFAYFSYLAINRHQRFYTQLYDMGWEHQVLHNLATTGVPYSTVESKEGIINWADHTSFIYYLIAPFYKLFPSVDFMLVLQVLSVILAAVFIFLLSDAVLKNKLYSLVISIVFLLHPSVQGCLLEDFHPSVLALPVFFLILLTAEKNNFIPVMICTALLCMIREDFIFFSFFVALFLLVTKKTDLKNFLWLTAMILLIGIVSFSVMKLSGSVANDYDRFYFITNNFAGVIATVFVNPFFIFKQLFSADRLYFILISSLPLLFLFFLHKPAWLLLLPAFLFTVFSRHLPHYLIGYHYGVMLVCAAFAGTIFYMRGKPALQKKSVALMFVLALFMNYFYGNVFSKSLRLVYVDPELAVEKPDFVYKNWQGYYRGLKGEKDEEIVSFIKTLSPRAKVAADSFIAPHLSGRRYLYSLKNYDWADVIVDRKTGNAIYDGFSPVKETRLWKVYKRK
ncbi:MAG TPA: DUF2079 domain-containing protein, partial [Candidatus Goldiibacteriota bacterium]|nr:DUF2079 domain-containing protein [Candidatus Goldiibacteriota bacterium]